MDAQTQQPDQRSPANKKPDMVTVSLTVTYPAKENMTIQDFTAEGQKALKLFEEAKKLGDATGHVAIGNKKYAFK